ncbi:MAG TPA: hypothetical protein VES42_25940, partial [Pilimelia sp.]|nr:hypothetical protein [Pilimelia sp.]
ATPAVPARATPGVPAGYAVYAPARPAAAPLSRRQPGATLEARPEWSRPAPASGSGGAPDPDEARDLVEQFEAGVSRALGEVSSSHHRRAEGSP